MLASSDIKRSVESLGLPMLMGLFFIALLTSFLFEMYAIALLPIIVFGALLAVYNYKIYYYLLFFSIPLSIEFYFGAFGTDLPTEPLMIVLAAIIWLRMIVSPERFAGRFFIHPISLIILASLGWMMITALGAYDQIISIKFILAKSWYLLSFFIGTLFFIEDINDVRKILKLALWPLFVTVSVVMIRHAAEGFHFSAINGLLGPAYRNHVIYAAIIVIFLPFVGFLSARHRHRKWGYVLMMIVLVAALYFSYTRAAYLSLIGMIGMYVIVRWKLTKMALVIGLIIPMALMTYLLPNNKYLDYSPDFHRTIAHYNFEDLVEATAKGEDASSMERVYRWVAAYHMIQERPVIGFGVGNFYSAYKPYTLFMFRTYVSDNKDKSGIHSYYFMTLVEQGFVGLILLLLLMVVFFIRAEQVYHRTTDPELKSLVMACILSFTALAILHTLNDLVEVDKTGAFFYMALALVIMIDIRHLTAVAPLEQNNPPSESSA